MKHFISIQDFGLDEILDILEEAQEMVSYAEERGQPSWPARNPLAKVTVLMMEPSTRTRISTCQAGELMGLRVEAIVGMDATSFAKKESFIDGMRTLAEEGTDVLAVRTEWAGGARMASEVYDRMGYATSVINCGDGPNRHPTQAMLNFLTIMMRLGRVHDFCIGFVGDLRYSRTIHSDLDMIQLLNQRFGDIRIKAVSVPEAALYEWQKIGLDVQESDSLEFLSDCDIVCATRIQKERYTDKNELKKVQGRYSIDVRALSKVLRDNVLIMHPGPRGPEVAPEISEDRHVIMWKQMGYGVPARMAIIRRCFEGRLGKVAALEDALCVLKTIVEESVESRLVKREAGEGAFRYFMPITERGMVIGHLSLGAGDRVKHLLKKHAGLRGDEGCIHVHEGVKVAKGTPDERRKDVVVLEGQHIGQGFYGPIRFMEPDVTFNVIKGGTFTKVKADMPNALPAGIFKCPNDDCITNRDPEAKARFYVQGDMAVCSYCCRPHSRQDIIEKM
ncbi:hypothetical protein KJ969_01320 [Patescibacteria group bacterium]|nr:hypothetical protein [Patescibacteria group bacterium]MBU1922326.1 hypothetical protein [Patescibacteria group bacterium]